MQWLEDSMTTYYTWLKDNTSLYTNNETGWSVITTPFIGLFNDGIEIYVKKEQDTITLSDDGETLRNLELCGISLMKSPKRKELLKMLTHNYGIIIQSTELTTTATEKDFPQKKHNLISAIAEISDMGISTKHNTSSLFFEDVRSYLDTQEIIYTPRFIAQGKTSLTFTFDFQIAGKRSEIVLKAFNTLSIMNIPHFLFGWQDIQTTRKTLTGKDITAIAIINDAEKPIDTKYLDALRSKGAKPSMWSERKNAETIAMLHAA